MTAHDLRLFKTRSIPYWSMSVFSFTVTDLVLIYEPVTSLASVVRWLTLHSWTLNFWILLRLTEWTKSASPSPSHIATDGQSVSMSSCRAPSGAHDQIFITVWQLRSCFCGATSLTRGRVCLSLMLLVLASANFLGSESLGARGHILLSQIWDFPFVASFDSQGPGGSIRPRLPHGHLNFQTCPSFISSGRTELSFQQFLYYSVFIRCCEIYNKFIETVWFYNKLIRNRGYVSNEPLSKNRLFRLSGVKTRCAYTHM
jgi:hypothetical protein